MLEPAPRRARWTPPRCLLVLLGCLALLYLPVFANDFVYDDANLILRSHVIHDLRNLPALFVHPTMFASGQYTGGPTEVDTYRPLTLVTCMWDAALSGTLPWAYHLTNLLAHLCCVWLVYRLTRALVPSVAHGGAWIAAAWFGTAPIAAEAHVWINGRSDLFTALFGLTAVLLWRRALSARGRVRAAWQLLAALSFLFGLLSKEVLLLCIPALIFWPESEPPPLPVWRRVLRVTPFAAAGLVYLALRAHALHGMRSYENAAQLQRAAWQLPWLWIDAAFQSVFPTHPHVRLLSEEYARLPSFAFAGATAAWVLIAALAIGYRRRAPLAFWTLLWFCLPLAPVAIISTMYWSGFGRYLYLPSAGLASGIAVLAAQLWRAQPRLHRFFAFALAGYGLFAVTTLEGVILSYRDTYALYTRVIDYRPEHAYGYGMLAASMSERLEGLDEIATLLERAEQLDPSVPRYAIQLVQTHLVAKQPELAAAAAERALRRFPSDSRLHYLAAVSRVAGDPQATVRHLVECLEHDPQFASCRTAIGMLCSDAAQCARFREPLRSAAARTELAELRKLLLHASASP